LVVSPTMRDVPGVADIRAARAHVLPPDRPLRDCRPIGTCTKPSDVPATHAATWSSSAVAYRRLAGAGSEFRSH
jgi:hypothetical protein